MTTYTLEMELSSQDPRGARDLSAFDVWCNDTYEGRAFSPNPPNNSDLGANDGPAPLGDNPALWQLNTFVLSTFSPSVNNHIAMGYTGSGVPGVNDYGHVRAVRVVGSDSSTYYGEYPLGYAYTVSVYEAGKHQGALDPATGLWLAGDGDFAPYQWNTQTNSYDNFPLGPDGAQSGLAHFYFTIPENRDLVHTATDLVGRRDSTTRTRVVGQTVQLDQSASNAVFNPRPTGGT